MQLYRKYKPADFLRFPVSLYGLSLILFFATAILPVVWMLGQFFISAAKNPCILSNILLDGRQLILLGRSLGIAVSATLVAFLIGLPVAIVLAARDLPFRWLFSFLMLTPLLIPPYIMAGAWFYLLSPSGAVNRTLDMFLGPSAMLKIQSVPGCIWCLGLSFFPLIAFIVSTGILRIDATLQDTARLCMGRWGVFRHSTVPQLKHYLAAAFCLALIFILSQYGVPSLLGVNTYPVEIFARFSAFYDEVSAVALSIPLVVLVVCLVLVQQKIMGTREYISITPRSDRGLPVALCRMKPFAIAFLLVLFAITIVLPLGSVLMHTNGLRTVQSTVSIIADAISFTTSLAFVAAVICTVIAFFLARLLVSSRSSYVGKILNVICWLPIAIPGTVVGLGFIRTLGAISWLRWLDSFGLFLLLAYVGMFCAFSIRIFYTSYIGTDPNVDEAASLDCPHWYQRCWHVDMRMHAGAIVVSLILVFVLSVGELNATVLLCPPGKDTVSVCIDNLLHYGANATASALCLIEAILVLIAIIGCLLAMKMLSKFSTGTAHTGIIHE